MHTSILVELKKAVLLAFVLLFLSAPLLFVLGFVRMRIVYCSPHTDIDVTTAHNMITNGSFPNLVVLDVRTKSEYDSGHVYRTLWIPHTELETRINELAGHENHEIIVYCQSGFRSNIAAGILDSRNFTKVYDMTGGILAWQSAGYPIWISTVHNLDTTFNYDTIQGAINDNETLDGHTIFVDAGVYVENIVVNKSVSLIGENRNAIVDGNGIENVLTITQNNATIVGFTLRNAGLHPNAGIHLNNTNYCNVTKNNIESGYYGILFEYSSNNTISGNTITNNTNGIYVEFSFNNNLRNNEVTFSSLAGLELRDSNSNAVSNNDLRNNDMCISLRYSSNNHINGNLISNGGAGIWVEQSVANLVSNNTIAHNQNGIILRLSGGNTLRNNNLTDNAYNFGHYQTVTHNLSHLINDIDPSNTINKKPIYYWVNQHNKQIPADASYVAIINSTNILVESLNLTQNPQDVLCAFSNNVTVKNLDVSHAWSLGILLLFSSNSIIANNSITNNNGGVGLWSSDSNAMINNTITFNFGDGIDLFYSEHNNIKDNMVVKNDNFGIHLVQSDNNIINRNIISNNSNNYPGSGIDLYNSRSNRITQNTISENGSPAFPSSGGIRTLYSSNNTIFHNNFNSNVRQVYTTDSTNAWDNGFEGNYWSDYNGKDANQDGIGDTPHIIDESNQDNYPLMGIFSDFKATSEFHVKTICNSSISSFQFNGTAISFNVTGENGTTGFCRICIPRTLMNGTYQVFVNGTEVPSNLLPCSNSTHSYPYFTYNHSTQEVIIVPEFPTWTPILLIFIVLTVAIIIYKRRLLKKSTHKKAIPFF